ncbi:radical SAM protein [Mycoplasmatota bacterium zrk1]
MYILGIINSRRLGKSLGIDIVGSEKKRCNMNCIYCECGYGKLESELGIYADFDVAMNELKKALNENEIDVVTFSGFGEPTLNIEIGKYIEGIKKLTDKPVCVITNSTTLHKDIIFNALLKSDIVIPSIDSVNKDIFRKVNKPHFDINLNVLKDSLIKFSNAYEGKLFLEVLLVKGINDSEEDLIELIEYVKLINPTELHINTVDRLPAEPLDNYNEEEIQVIYKMFQNNLSFTVKLF